MRDPIRMGALVIGVLMLMVGCDRSPPNTATAPAQTPIRPASCAPSAILPVVGRALAGSDVEIDTVDVEMCRGGYAHVFVVPRRADVEEEQVFLVDHRGEWMVITTGSGITCQDADLHGRIRAACEALYP